MKNILLLTLAVLAIFNNNVKAQCPPGTFTGQIFPGTAANGKVITYRKSYTGAQWDSISATTVTTPTFVVNIADSGKYILKFIPTSGYQISYADTGQYWNQATTYHLPCGANYFAYFFCQPFGSLGGTGTGSLSGKIIEGQKFGQKPSGVTAPGNPIGGIIVKGGKNPGAQLFAQTTTDANGDYSFSNLPPGDYFILVDIPGLDSSSTHHVTLNNNSVSNLGFVVDSLKINPSNDVSVNEINKEKYGISVSPNPTSRQCTVKYSLLKSSSVNISLYDIVGHKAKEITLAQGQGEHKHSIPVSDLKPGLYFIRLSIDDQETVIKLLITE
jgi:hypothetical protein